MVKCDTCGKTEDHSFELNSIADEYKTDKFSHICGKCLEKLDKKIRDIDRKHAKERREEIKLFIADWTE